MGKDRVINSTEWFQLEGGKKPTQLSYQSASVSKEPLTVRPLVFHLSGCSAAAHKWKKPIPSRLLYYGFEFLDFWLEVLVRHSFHCQFHPPINEAPAPLCLNALQLLSHGPAQLSGSSPPGRHASGVRPHTQHETAHVTRLLQAALLPGVAGEFFSAPLEPPEPGRPWPAESRLVPRQLHQFQRSGAARQFADRKLNLVRKELQILNDSGLRGTREGR